MHTAKGVAFNVLIWRSAFEQTSTLSVVGKKGGGCPVRSTGFENKSRPTPCLLSREGVIHTPPPLCRQTTTGTAMVPRVLWCLLGCALGGFPSARAITSTSTSDITSDPSCVTVQVSAMFLMCAVDDTRMLAALGDKGGYMPVSLLLSVTHTPPRLW